MSKMDKISQDFKENFEKYEEDARREREESVNWKIVRENCTPRQILAIHYFIEYRMFEGAASLANMKVPDFMDLLQKLGISLA
ncbi:MAG: hypothetical protein ACTSW1_17410 [Candidatus Hodarchaeales archaeon]